MSNKIIAGGSAFPHPEVLRGANGWLPSAGMTLRDYFAAKAMQAIISSALSEKTKTNYNINNPDFLECLSLDAYAHAEAMLKARGGQAVSASMQCEKCFRSCRLSKSGKTWICTICKHREKAKP